MDNETVAKNAMKDASITPVSAQLIRATMRTTTSSAVKRARAKREPLIEASLLGAQFDVRFTVRRSDAMQCAQWLSERAVEQRKRRAVRAERDATSVRVKQVTKGGVA